MIFFTNLLKIYKKRKLYLTSSLLDSTIGVNFDTTRHNILEWKVKE